MDMIWQNGTYKSVHGTYMYVQGHACTYMHVLVHTWTCMYLHACPCIYLDIYVHTCMYSFQYTPIFWQHPTSKQLLEQCCVHHPSTVSHILLGKPSKITIYGLTWYIEVHTCIYMYKLCMYIKQTCMFFVHNHTLLPIRSYQPCGACESQPRADSAPAEQPLSSPQSDPLTDTPGAYIQVFTCMNWVYTCICFVCTWMNCVCTDTFVLNPWKCLFDISNG